MFKYEHSRTEQIVANLIKIESVVRVITILSTSIIFGFIGLSAGLTFGVEAAIVVVVIGIVIGIFVGKYSMLLISATIEWGAQLLIAQGEILSELRKLDKK